MTPPKIGLKHQTRFFFQLNQNTGSTKHFAYLYPKESALIPLPSCTMTKCFVSNDRCLLLCHFLLCFPVQVAKCSLIKSLRNTNENICKHAKLNYHISDYFIESNAIIIHEKIKCGTETHTIRKFILLRHSVDPYKMMRYLTVGI